MSELSFLGSHAALGQAGFYLGAPPSALGLWVTTGGRREHGVGCCPPVCLLHCPLSPWLGEALLGPGVGHRAGGGLGTSGGFSPPWLLVLPLACLPEQGCVCWGQGALGASSVCLTMCTFISPPPPPRPPSTLSVCMPLFLCPPSHDTLPRGMAHPSPHGPHLPGTAWLAA